MIETSSVLPRNLGLLSVIFGNLRKMFGKCSETFVKPSEQFWKIFGTILENLRKSSESGRKSSESRQKHRYQFGYIINRIIHGRLETWNSSSRVHSRYLTRSLRSLVRYRCEHSKINSISPRVHVLFSISAAEKIHIFSHVKIRYFYM